MDDSLHLMPLVHFESIVGDGCRQVSSGVSMQTISIWQLGLVVLTIWLHEGLNVSQRLLNLLLHSIHEGKVANSWLHIEVLGGVDRPEVSHLFR